MTLTKSISYNYWILLVCHFSIVGKQLLDFIGSSSINYWIGWSNGCWRIALPENFKLHLTWWTVEQPLNWRDPMVGKEPNFDREHVGSLRLLYSRWILMESVGSLQLLYGHLWWLDPPPMKHHIDGSDKELTGFLVSLVWQRLVRYPLDSRI